MGPFTTASATQQTSSFSSPITLTKGLYFLAVLGDVTGTMTSISNTSQNNIYGAPAMNSANGASLYVTETYANGLTDLTGASLVYANGLGSFYLGIQKA